MKYAPITVATFCLPLALALPGLCAAASAADNKLGTIFYSPAERAELSAKRDGYETGLGQDTSYFVISGYVKREGDKSTAWINGQPVSEKSRGEGTLKVLVGNGGVTINNKPAKVGETMDADTGEHASRLPPDAVKVGK